MKNKRTKKRPNWERYLELAAEAGSVAMSLRDRPTRLDWLGLVLRGVSLAFRVRAEKRAHQAKSPWDYFQCDGFEAEWSAVPDSLAPLVVRHVRELEVAATHWDGRSDSSRVFLGKLGSEEVGWVADSDGSVVDGPYVKTARQEETFRALGTCVWRGLGAEQLLFGKEGIATDPYAGDEVAPTSQFRRTLGRLERFREGGVARSYLFAGPPGTGKSSGIRYLARELGGPSLRVELAVLSRTFERRRMDSLLGSVEVVVRALRPDILIVDDIDRVTDEADLLHLLELAGRICGVVLASANCTSKMTGALLRPGRFDELIEVRRPDRDIVRSLVGDDEAVIRRLEDLPIAYIAEFVKRRDALGLDVALAELDELSARRRRAEE